MICLPKFRVLKLDHLPRGTEVEESLTAQQKVIKSWVINPYEWIYAAFSGHFRSHVIGLAPARIRHYRARPTHTFGLLCTQLVPFLLLQHM